MKLTKALETENIHVMDDYWDSYLKGDLQKWSDYLPENYRNIGTTKDKILQPFFTTKKGTQGTGLGLSITNDIIKAHGGRMKIDSVPELKTTFSIHLEKRG